MVDQVGKVSIAVSEDADHPVRTAIKGTEDEMNKLVTSINKALTQLEDLIVVRTRMARFPGGES
jgi:hypothetical protein